MNTPPRIALMLPRFSRYGGVEQFGYRLAEALAQKGYAVDFICARQEAEAPAGVRVITVGRPAGAKVLKMLWFLVRAEQARRKGNYDLSISLGKTWNQDIARIGGGPIQAFWRLSQEAWPEGAPRTIKKLSRWVQPANWLSLLVEKRLYHKSAHIVAISDTVRGWVEEVYPHLALPPEQTGQQLLTIYNCPDVSRFAPPTPEARAEARAALGMQAGEYALALATTNFALKGVAPMIRSLPLMPQDTHLHIAGGRGAEPYKKLAASLGVAERVHFHGKVENMQQFYHAADMFILPTFYDTLGNVVLEALGCGLKTICSNRAGAAAFLPAEQVLQNPGDPAEIAAKVLALREQDAPVVLAPKGAGIEELAALVDGELARRGVLPTPDLGEQG